MSNLSRLLQEIKDNPVMYLDKPSIICLHSFLNGYLDGRVDLGLDREGSGMEGFQDWIQKRAKTNATESWAGIILFGSGTERIAFYRFFEEFAQFLKQKNNSKTQESEDVLRLRQDFNFRQFDIYNEILKGIKTRPGVYLGRSSITRLDMVLRGTSLARREVGVPPTEPEREFEGFQSWVQEKYGINSGQSWSKIILFYSVDEHEALLISCTCMGKPLITQVAGYESPSVRHLKIDAIRAASSLRLIANNKLCGCATHNQH